MICNYTYIFTKCNDIFKFYISLRLNGVKTFIAVTPQTGLFSIARFFNSSQKIFTNKNIFSKVDLHILFTTFFSKLYNKQKSIFHLTMRPVTDHYSFLSLLIIGSSLKNTSFISTYNWGFNVSCIAAAIETILVFVIFSRGLRWLSQSAELLITVP